MATQDTAYHSKAVAQSLLVALPVNLDALRSLPVSLWLCLAPSTFIITHMAVKWLSPSQGLFCAGWMYSVEEDVDSHGDLVRNADIVVGSDACLDLSEVHLATLNAHLKAAMPRRSSFQRK